jgi:hypothetical protein
VVPALAGLSTNVSVETCSGKNGCASIDTSQSDNQLTAPDTVRMVTRVLGRTSFGHLPG